MERRERIRRFVATSLGRAILLAVSTITLAMAFVYLGPFVAIPTFLVFGLAIPIYLGWKRPRSLALAGLAALLIAAPVAATLETQMLLVPSPPVSSFDKLPYGNGGPVLANATVSPFSAPGGTPFTFRVLVQPSYLPPHASLAWVELFVSTCPDATGNRTPPDCTAGFPFYERNYTVAQIHPPVSPGSNLTAPFVVSFNQTLGGTNIWWWTMIAGFHNATSGRNGTILLFPSTGYPTVQGPITGDYLSTLGIVIPSVYIGMFFYSGSVFYFALLVYLFFKSRERRRANRAALAGGTSRAAPPGGAPGAPPADLPPDERPCPNCGALVYPGESQCWKCGRPLSPSDPARSEAPATGTDRPAGPPPLP